MLEMILSNFCACTANVWNLVGKVVSLLKILIPVIIIVLGIIAFAKAVIADDSEKEMKNAVSKLVIKIVTGILIFFIPTIIQALFSFTGSFSDESADYQTCVTCITSTCPDQASAATGTACS